MRNQKRWRICTVTSCGLLQQDVFSNPWIIAKHTAPINNGYTYANFQIIAKALLLCVVPSGQLLVSHVLFELYNFETFNLFVLVFG